MEENVSPMYSLPLPHKNNELREDVMRIISAFLTIDSLMSKIDKEVALKADTQDLSNLTHILEEDITQVNSRLAPVETLLNQHLTSLGSDQKSGHVYIASSFESAIDNMAVSFALLKSCLQKSIPKGIITLWSGIAPEVPQGWSLCDGTNNTPDLRNRFVIGASPTIAKGSTGGSNENAGILSDSAPDGYASHGTSSNPLRTTQGATLNGNQMTYHAHTIGCGGGISAGGGQPQTSQTGTLFYGAVSDYAGANHAHSHGIPAHDHAVSTTAHSHIFTSSPNSNLPPYFALAYIMFIGEENEE